MVRKVSKQIPLEGEGLWLLGSALYKYFAAVANVQKENIALIPAGFDLHECLEQRLKLPLDHETLPDHFDALTQDDARQKYKVAHGQMVEIAERLALFRYSLEKERKLANSARRVTPFSFIMSPAQIDQVPVLWFRLDKTNMERGVSFTEYPIASDKHSIGDIKCLLELFIKETDISDTADFFEWSLSQSRARVIINHDFCSVNFEPDKSKGPVGRKKGTGKNPDLEQKVIRTAVKYMDDDSGPMPSIKAALIYHKVIIRPSDYTPLSGETVWFSDGTGTDKEKVDNVVKAITPQLKLALYCKLN